MLRSREKVGTTVWKVIKTVTKRATETFGNTARFQMKLNNRNCGGDGCHVFHNLAHQDKR